MTLLSVEEMANILGILGELPGVLRGVGWDCFILACRTDTLAEDGSIKDSSSGSNSLPVSPLARHCSTHLML